MSNFLRGFLFLISLLLFFTSFYLVYIQVSFLQHAKRASGTIVDYVERCSGSDFDNCDSSSKIEFITDTGETISFVNRLSSKTTVESVTKQKTTPNTTVAVLYDPQNPQDARIDSFMNKWFLPIFSLTTSVLLILFVTLTKKR
ncbi:MAG TPA: DUF3592 domain-containing protein [Candidatus Woesebacteria bacterium]|jgi:hypothetical protein|nr:DUF3592 domain-containing protein [Candidatus Woesebacteria bacterium]HNS65744.1 DUF3592 domain-containing protein [Candidatus Woesebacteria bacterium]